MEIQNPENELQKKVIDTIKTCYDPEIPVNIYELGLIYEIDINKENHAHVKMSLTSPACPVAGSLPGEIEAKILGIDEIKKARVEVVWEPQWTPDMMSEVARYELGMM